MFENQLTRYAKILKALAHPLTRQEKTLALIATGKSNQQIARLLYISIGTVRVHDRAILPKLKVRDRT